METNKEEVQALIERLKRLESALETKNSKGPEADVSSPSPPPPLPTHPIQIRRKSFFDNILL